MEFSYILVTLIVWVALAFMGFNFFQTLKFEGEADTLNLLLGVASGFLAFFGIQSGVSPDYAACLAIVGISSLLYAVGESRDDVREAKEGFLAKAEKEPAKS